LLSSQANYTTKTGTGAPVTTTYAYDQDGRMIEETDPGSPSRPASVTISGYDPVGNLSFKIDPQGSAALPGGLTNAPAAIQAIEATGTTNVSTLKTLVNAINNDSTYNLNTTTYTYDAQNHKLSEKDPNLGNSTTPNVPTTSWAYDPNGNDTVEQDSNSNTTNYQYDELNREIKESTHVYLNSGTGNDSLVDREYFYDGVGNTKEVIDRDGRATTFDYDHLDRLTSEKWFAGSTTTSGTQTDTLTYSYDPDSRLTSIDDSSTSGPPDIQYQYDDLGNETLCTQNGDGLDAALTQSYDPNGNRTQVKAAIGSSLDFVNQYAYNEFDEMTGVWQNDQITSGFDSSFYQRAQIDSKASIFGYNLVGQMTSQRDFDNVNASGFSNLATGTTLSGASSTELPAADQTWTYDTGGMLASIGGYNISGANSAANAAFTRYSYRWNPDGTMSQFIIDGQPRVYGYDSTDQLTSEPAKSYGYDSNGNRIAGPGAAVSSGVGADNRIQADADWTYTYDAEGNI
jgi:YD repeat-containing protein